MAAMKVEHYDETTGQCDLRDEDTGRRFRARCEPTGRNRYENKNSQQEVFMQTETLNAGQELDAKVKLYAAQHNVNYGAALHQVKRLEPELYRAYAFDETPLDREVRKGASEFGRRVTAYSEHFNISRDEAKRRVGQHDPAMAVFVDDPMGPIRVRGETEPRPSAGVEVTQMPPGQIHSTALMQIAALLGGIPKNADMTISFDQAARVLQAGYLDLLIKAAGEKLDSLARAEISIQGKPGFTSENYPQAFDAARRKYPALTQIYSGGRITLQGLTELLPHFQFVAD